MAEDQLKPHQFKKGQSGNPGGRPKGIFSVTRRAQEAGEEAVEFLLSVMRNAEEETKDRIAAARDILDRGFGKPKQQTELTGGDGVEINIVISEKIKNAVTGNTSPAIP